MKRASTTFAAAFWIAVLPGFALAQANSSGGGTVFLQCGGQLNFTIDYARNTVNNIPANVNATAIDWTEKTAATGAPVTVVQDFHLDRTTGVLNLTDTVLKSDGSLFPGDNNPNRSSYNCAVASAPATKF
jgi:hypothetical protein